MLLVPEELSTRKVRCAFCDALFDAKSPRRAIVGDEIIANWLQEGAFDPDDEASDSFDPSEKTYIAPAVTEPQCRLRRLQPAEPGHVDVAVAHAAGQVRVVHIGPRWVEFEFEADRLLCPEFRCAMPRKCMRCGSDKRLRAYLTMFTTHVQEQVDLAAEHHAGHLSLSSKELGALSGLELLARLPLVPSVPFPGNLPFPYFVCDQCSESNLVAGTIQVHSETHKGHCRMLLRNLPLAAEFYATVGDKHSDDYRRLQQALEDLKSDPWSSLPVAVRHRVEQWFRSGPNETFLAFVRDADYSTSEQGMSGLLVSTRRVLYHRPPRHREITVDDRLIIRVADRGDRQLLRLESAEFKNTTLTTDRSGLRLLRKGLHLVGAHVTWE
jgi:hypothetical protein